MTVCVERRPLRRHGYDARALPSGKTRDELNVRGRVRLRAATQRGRCAAHAGGSQCCVKIPGFDCKAPTNDSIFPTRSLLEPTRRNATNTSQSRLRASMSASLPAAACGHVDALAWSCSGADCSDTACRVCAKEGLAEEPDAASEGRAPTRSFEPWHSCDFCLRRECDDCGDGTYSFCEEPDCTKFSCRVCDRIYFCACSTVACPEHAAVVQCTFCNKMLCSGCDCSSCSAEPCVSRAATHKLVRRLTPPHAPPG